MFPSVVYGNGLLCCDSVCTRLSVVRLLAVERILCSAPGQFNLYLVRNLYGAWLIGRSQSRALCSLAPVEVWVFRCSPVVSHEMSNGDLLSCFYDPTHKWTSFCHHPRLSEHYCTSGR